MHAGLWAIVTVSVIGTACDRRQPREGTPGSSAVVAGSSSATGPNESAASGAAAAGCTLPEVPLRYPAPNRLVAIGDLHGDIGGTRSALRAAGAIDDKDKWIGGELMIVQTGDVLDRGDDEQQILDLLFALEAEAKAAGGAVILLNGNHELMNAAGDFRYVTRGAMGDFDDVHGVDASRWKDVPEIARKRFAALAPGGVYAKKLAAHNVLAIVGDTMFSHAGVVGEWALQIDEVNHTSRCWLDGQLGGPETPPITMTSEESPVWTRALGLDPVDCKEVGATLSALGIERQVVGHTVQNQMNSVCDGAIWRIDVGLAKVYDGPIEVLELYPTPRVLAGTR